MATEDEPTEPSEPTDPLALGQAAAAHLGGEWQLDIVEEFAEGFEADATDETPAPPVHEAPPTAPAAEAPPHVTRSTATSKGLRPPSLADGAASEVPPSPEQLVEAMLFVGGHPLAAEVACAAVRGLTPERFQEAVAVLNKRYRDQHRPYLIESRDDGFVLSVRPAYRGLREKLFGGPREARLSQPALDVLSVVAYRQPLSKAEVDVVRGTDSGPALRQLVRLGLIAVRHRADAAEREVRYGTTPRFLQVFGLQALDELPRLGDAQPGS
ncbi:SMC-Scp complex subunit ScpB [Gemmata sp. JC673]|uniref:SMC-Scp complex subunit ScpB n=1 Tax=Gemmata algarum TaxID=2975278 RepID=A0ABU5EVP6_9BACT|nr:SMC-Scp complex subunit ScpB [Gemmata algarum]MDY3559371.1 SMC-Scp complex subunit ScpB [Gemmata algarum]